ncbi:hypothetical protein BDW59DRAFT_163622 [Aspergillus cavernicola]|uniref:Uncharacterized protein n=1 Tax=Aspergillus cavernicola TaxID=176166 RepID=A0ABR4I599_9EURO
MTPSPKKRQATQPTAQFNKDASKFIGLHAYCWRPCMEGYEGQQILVVSRPGIAYEGGERLGKYDFTIDVMDAEVLAMFIPADGEIFDEIDEEEEEPAGKAVKKQDDGDEDWVEEKEE